LIVKSGSNIVSTVVKDGEDGNADWNATKTHDTSFHSPFSDVSAQFVNMAAVILIRHPGTVIRETGGEILTSDHV
jgi:hypothetical protein